MQRRSQRSGTRLRVTALSALFVALTVMASSCGAPSGTTVTSVAVVGSGGSSEVRQGAGSVDVTVSGSGLDGASSLSLGDLTTSITSATATSIAATVEVPHGAAIGPRNLSVTTASGTATRSNALTVTAITAAPGGDDLTGRGTTDAPFRTLTRAVQAASPGDTVRLRNGSYAAGTESFPLEVSGLTIAGESQAGVIVSGNPLAAGAGLLVVSGDTRFVDLTLESFNVAAINVTGGDAHLERVHVRDVAQDGVRVRHAGVVIEDSLVERSGDDNLDIEGDATVLIVASVIADAGDTNVKLGDSGSNDALVATITGSTISGAGGRGVNIRGASQVTIVDTVVSGSGADNVRIREAASLTMTGSSALDSNSDGLDFESSGALVIRSSTFTGNGSDGVDVGSNDLDQQPALVDLGTEDDPGGNLITGNAVNDPSSSFDLRDERLPGTDVVISAVGNTFAVALSGLQTGVDSLQGIWSIEGEGNQIDFGP
jgi:hypothetical protein